ncbi:hypothetical protein OSB04_031629, partial [Centaurea solstitialis]
MVFVTRLSRRPKGFVLLWAVVIRLLNCKRHLLSRGCVAEIVRRRDIPLSTVSDRDARLYLDAWRSFQLDLETRVTITTANGLHSDGQNSLRTCVLDFRGSWSNHLPVEASRMRSTCHVTNLMACFAESKLRAKLHHHLHQFLSSSPSSRFFFTIKVRLRQSVAQLGQDQ